MKSLKETLSDYPVHELILSRWSPYGFGEQLVSAEELCALFEAARWAPSCFNEQPWRYILARRDQGDEFARLLSCLVGPNQEWAKFSPVLVLGITSLNFERNGKPNRHAIHDLGLASAQLTMEATNRGLSVHQMGGILPDRARELYNIPEDYEVVTALAIGHRGTGESLSDSYKERDLQPRQRKPLREFLFESSWGRASTLLHG